MATIAESFDQPAEVANKVLRRAQVSKVLILILRGICLDY